MTKGSKGVMWGTMLVQKMGRGFVVELTFRKGSITLFILSMYTNSNVFEGGGTVEH
jgi:hypothetical protein